MMLEHRCAALFISPMLKHRCAALFNSPMTETPLKNTGDCFPQRRNTSARHFLFSSQSQKHPIPPSFSLPKQLRPALVSFFFPLPLLQHHSQQLFLLLKHRLSAILHPFPPMLKHHCSTYFSSPSHHLSHSPSSTKQFRPAIVSPLLLLKHHLPATFHHFIHDAETPSFSTLSSSSDTETPVISSSSSQFFDLSLLLQHPLSTDDKFLRFPTTVQTAGCDMIKKQPTKQHHHEKASYPVGLTNPMVRRRYVKFMQFS
jgi:hypothetical protein